MDHERDPELAKFAAALRAQVDERMRSRPPQTHFATTKASAVPHDRPENPLKEFERHRKAFAPDQEKRLSSIAHPQRQKHTRDQVDELYMGWEKALKRAHARRFDDSAKLYDRKLGERKIDPRLLTPRQKEEIHHEAVHEAVAKSNMLIKEINGSMPRMIDATIDTAVKLTTDAEKSYSSTPASKAANSTRKSPLIPRNRENDHDRER